MVDALGDVAGLLGDGYLKRRRYGPSKTLLGPVVADINDNVAYQLVEVDVCFRGDLTEKHNEASPWLRFHKATRERGSCSRQASQGRASADLVTHFVGVTLGHRL